MFTSSKHKSIQIVGGTPLKGVIEIQGSKNSVLPAIAASLMVKKGKSVIRNVPYIQDVLVSIEIAQSLGAKIDYDIKEKVLVVDAEGLNHYTVPLDLSEKLRASVLFAAPLLVRLGKSRLLGAGGCKIGERKLDYHHRGFVRLGATLSGNQQTDIIVQADSLKGDYVYMDMPSHTGTENLMMAAALASGDTIIDNAASDPEVVDFANLLIAMGADIRGAGTRTIYVSGMKELRAFEYSIISDRHDASAFSMAVAISGGSITLKNFTREHQRLTEAKLVQMGVEFRHGNDYTVVTGPKTIAPINVITSHYPGFPTDAQPSITALATVAQGRSYIRETIFEDRFSYIEQMNNMGADIVISKSNVIIVEGVKKLHGTRVWADDLRAGFALIIAAVVAEGETIIDNPYQIERGHELVIERLTQLGVAVSEVEK